MLALIDANNFYCSCERAFDPELRGKPLVVLSNNDGCIISRSNEAKALGLKMAEPWHLAKDRVSGCGVEWRSSNYALYGDMSRRVYQVLCGFVPSVEPYSIDEMFLDLAGMRGRVRLAKRIRDAVLRATKIPTCIGIGPTKTLAKAGNKLAKRGPGVVDLSDTAARTTALADLPVGDVWGVGARWEAKLRALGIDTAAALRDASTELIGSRFGVVLARTQRELQGHPCAGVEPEEPNRRQIMVSRSFSARVDDHTAVLEAMASFMVRAAEKMRGRGLAAGGVWIFANTDTFRPELRQHHPSRALSLATPTTDTRELLRAVRRLAANFLRAGCAYRRAGVALLDLARVDCLQQDLFARHDGRDKLMPVLDAINRRFGRSTAGFGATGWRQAPVWRMRQSNVSAHYTTRWSDLPRAIC